LKLKKSGILRQNIVFFFHVGCSVFWYGEISPNFDLEKYDFNLFKGFFMGKKKGPNSPNFDKLFFKSPDFYDKFQQVAKNIEGFWFLKNLISSM